MTQRFSLYLDFLRFSAAMIVFLSHFAYPRFTDGTYSFIRDLNLGSDAVVFFFVLSGLVIAYTADTKDKTLKMGTQKLKSGTAYGYDNLKLSPWPFTVAPKVSVYKRAPLPSS